VVADAGASVLDFARGFVDRATATADDRVTKIAIAAVVAFAIFAVLRRLGPSPLPLPCVSSFLSPGLITLAFMNFPFTGALLAARKHLRRLYPFPLLLLLSCLCRS
jgi:hypothetical protein